MANESTSAVLPVGFPIWLDKFYFRNLLRSTGLSQCKVVQLKVSNLSENMANFSSNVYRVKVTAETGEKEVIHRHLIVKLNYKTQSAVDLLEGVDAFPKEIEIYNEIIPKFTSLFNKTGETIRFGPECLIGTHDPENLIIMEDLSATNYRLADRVSGLDRNHVQLVLKKLAQIHAASAVYLEQGGSFDKKYDNGTYSEAMRPGFEKIFQKSSPMLYETIKELKCAGIFSELPKNWREILLKKTSALVNRNDSRLNVLCHGDLWCNNIMFRYNEESGMPEDCLFLDFQLCIFNSPMLDLHFFFVTSLQHELKLTQIDDLIYVYHKELVQNLKRLDYSKDPPKLLDLQLDFLTLGLYGVTALFGLFRLIIAPSPDDCSLKDVDDRFRRHSFDNPRYKEALEDLIPYYARKGYFDQLK